MKATRKTWNQYGPISGSGNLILDDSTGAGGDGGGGGRFQFYGANTYTGTTTIKYIGIKDPGLQIHHANALQNSTLIYDNSYIPNNGENWKMLAFVVDNIVLGGLSGDRSGINYSDGKTISIGNNDANTTYSGNLSIGTLNKIGSGTLTLSGTNSFALELTEGELNVGSANAIGSSGAITFSGGTLQHSASNTTDYSSRFSLSDSDTLKIDTNGQSVTWASDLTASNLLVTKYGTGNLYINGSYSGNTNAVAGSIYISGALSNNINNLTLTGNTTYTSLSAYSSINLSSYILTVNLSSDETFANAISGTGSLIKTGAAALTLSGTNTFRHL
jgi:autotransporter-associated beta strand protein